MTKAGMIFGGVAIAALVGTIAVTVANGDFMALLSSITERSSVERAQKAIGSAAPSQQPEVKQSDAIEPVPAPRTALSDPTPPAPVANESTSSAKTAPAEILVPDAGSGTRTALTAEEKAAVDRGLKELGITAATSTSSPPTEQATTAELNRKGLADSATEEARAKQLQAQNQQRATQQYEEQKRVWEKQQEEYLAQLKSAGSNP